MDLDGLPRSGVRRYAPHLLRRLQSLPPSARSSSSSLPSSPSPSSLALSDAASAADDDAEFADPQLDAVALSLDESLSALHSLRESLLRSGAVPSVLPLPVVFDHQVYTIVRDRTVADRQIDQLFRRRQVLKFRIPGGGGFALVLSDDYDAMLAEMAPPSSIGRDAFVRLQARMSALMRDPETDVSISESLLKEKLSSTDADIVALLHAGLVVRGTEASSYWFSLPSLGSFLQQLRAGNAAVLQIVRRSRFQEIMLSVRPLRVLVKRLRVSRLGVQYHVDDLIGNGGLVAIRTTDGVLLRMGVKQTDTPIG